MTQPPHDEPGSRLPAAALLACTAVAFWPVTTWLAGQTAARQQLLQAAIILCAAAVALFRRNRGMLVFRLETGGRALAFLGISYALAVVAWLAQFPLLWLPALAFAFAGLAHVLFGESGGRILKPLILGFACLLAIVVAFPLADWPLRRLAGTGAAQCLHAIGLASRLAIVVDGGAVKLVLSTGRELFEVATECNGFGLITSSALLALVLGSMGGRRWWDLFLLALSGMIIGFAGNVLRILLICLLAPSFPGHYAILHEAAGTVILWAGLGATAWLAWPGRMPAPAGQVSR